MLHALQGDHLGDQQVQHVRLDARPVLHGPGEGLGERRAGLAGAVRAACDLRLEVAEHLLEDDVDLGAPLVTAGPYPAQIPPPHSSQEPTLDTVTVSTVRVLAARLGSYALPLVWVPRWLTALSSLSLWEEGLLEFVLILRVFFSMNTAISTCISISSASIRARLSAPTFPSLDNCPKRSLSPGTARAGIAC